MLRDPGNLIAGVLFNVAAMDTTRPDQLNHQFFMTRWFAFVACPWFILLTMRLERSENLRSLEKGQKLPRAWDRNDTKSDKMHNIYYILYFARFEVNLVIALVSMH